MANSSCGGSEGDCEDLGDSHTLEASLNSTYINSTESTEDCSQGDNGILETWNNLFE